MCFKQPQVVFDGSSQLGNPALPGILKVYIDAQWTIAVYHNSTYPSYSKVLRDQYNSYPRIQHMGPILIRKGIFLIRHMSIDIWLRFLHFTNLLGQSFTRVEIFGVQFSILQRFTHLIQQGLRLLLQTFLILQQATDTILQGLRILGHIFDFTMIHRFSFTRTEARFRILQQLSDPILQWLSRMSNVAQGCIIWVLQPLTRIWWFQFYNTP